MQGIAVPHQQKVVCVVVPPLVLELDNSSSHFVGRNVCIAGMYKFRQLGLLVFPTMAVFCVITADCLSCTLMRCTTKNYGC